LNLRCQVSGGLDVWRREESEVPLHSPPLKSDVPLIREIPLAGRLLGSGVVVGCWPGL